MNFDKNERPESEQWYLFFWATLKLYHSYNISYSNYFDNHLAEGTESQQESFLWEFGKVFYVVKSINSQKKLYRGDFTGTCYEEN